MHAPMRNFPKLNIKKKRFTIYVINMIIYAVLLSFYVVFKSIFADEEKNVAIRFLKAIWTDVHFLQVSSHVFHEKQNKLVNIYFMGLGL